MLQRMTRVARLDRAIYAEVERDLTRRAAAVVGLVAVASALAIVLQVLIGTEPKGASTRGAIVGALISPFIHWFIWSAITAAVGSRLFGARSTYPTVLRAIGYAQAPQVLSVFGFLPVVGPVIVTVGRLLSMRAGSLALGDALGLAPRRTIVTIVLSFAIAFVVGGLVRAGLAHVGFLTGLLSP